MKYRKKPIIIEAFQMTRERCRSTSGWPAWLRQAWRMSSTTEGALFRGSDDLFIQTLEGTHRVSIDDWIIQGVEGLHVCKPKIFDATYEVVYEANKPWTQMGEGAMW